MYKQNKQAKTKNWSNLSGSHTVCCMGPHFFVSLKPFMTLSVCLGLLSYGQIRFFTNSLMRDNMSLYCKA